MGIPGGAVTKKTGKRKKSGRVGRGRGGEPYSIL